MNITAGTYNGRKIISRDEKITRPTLSKVRMSVFNTLFSMLGDFSGKTFLDLFGGSGIMGLEAISRGFKEVTVFEKNIKAAEIIKKNYEMLGIKPNLIIGDSIKLIQNHEAFYDVTYIDPPYESGIYEKILPLVKSKIIVIEHPKTVVFTQELITKQKTYGDTILTFISK